MEINLEKEMLNFERDIEVTPVRWLWYPYIPLGKITIMQGNSGEGKTMLALNIAAALSHGEGLPGDTAPREPIDIIYNTAEDGLSDTIKPRLLAAGADCSRIHTINERVNTITMTDDRVELNVTNVGAKLLILDPIQAYLGSNVDMNKANEVRPVFARLGRIAEDNGCAIVLIGHKGKNQAYSDINALLGSMDQVAAARSVLTVMQHPKTDRSRSSHTPKVPSRQRVGRWLSVSTARARSSGAISWILRPRRTASQSWKKQRISCVNFYPMEQSRRPP
ncbi:MAG: AAA family ATPase [Lachnospiraceae bacterium]|nr:AAA family ATPase [Ruminococcus sp.]MCM1274220.1 AAA family ATPase [Lachnospiraceae bacterium]